MSGRKLTIVLGIVVVAAVSISVFLVQRRTARAVEERARIEDAIVRGQGRKAVEMIDASTPGVLDPEWAALRRGDALVLQRAFKDAKVVAEEVLARDPSSVPGLLLRARAMAGQGYYDDAFTDLERAAQLEPKNPDVLAERSQIWVGRKDEQKALADLDAAIAADPTHVQALKQRCVLLYGMHRLQEALKDCEAALKGMPTNHRDRTFAEYAHHEVLEDLEKEEDARNAEFAPPPAGAAAE